MIQVQVFNAHPKYKVDVRDTIRLARRVFKREGRAQTECSLVFINDKRMTAMNGKYLNHWYATDVLSFPYDEDRDTIFGEVYINLDQARRQAKEYKVAIKNEVRRLVIHGILHLAGFKDGTKQQKTRMTEAENTYLRNN
jgi:rRNA maturation RNase YbeY